MKEKHVRYEKPILEKLDVVGEGQFGPCTNGSITTGPCQAGGSASGQCEDGSKVAGV